MALQSHNLFVFAPCDAICYGMQYMEVSSDENFANVKNIRAEARGRCLCISP